MSDIEVGDLVMVVRWPCCGVQLGKIFRVNIITDLYTTFNCPCGSRNGLEESVAWDGLPGGVGAYPSWLKRIPPLADLERVTEKEELTA